MDYRFPDFNDVSFNLLMKKRIHKVLLVCSKYDSFVLEEDGRIDEQIFNEYVSLNLRYPPVFIQAFSSEHAFEILENEEIDLIITMLNIGNTDVFELANKIKKKYNKKPIVVLTPFSRTVSIKLKDHNTHAIDYVFSWLGDSSILLAIIKLIEDLMNVDDDVKSVSVQTIILVENSIRFYSSYLPSIYKIIYEQSKEFMIEGLNEHQQMLRMRGRPKILLATNYEDAVYLYEKYKNNLLGVISDVAYNRNGKKDKNAGVRFCKLVLKEDKYLPFLLQSSDIRQKEVAKKLKVKFLYKQSSSLLRELQEYIEEYLAFGRFTFRDPKTMKVTHTGKDLKTLQEKIYKISDDSLIYHLERNHFSKWLNARALFTLAERFKYLKIEEFDNTDEIRKYLYETISSFRMIKSRGVIADFNKSDFDKYLIFSRIGNGSIGGKARGLAFIDTLIKRNKIRNEYPNTIIQIPRTIVLSTDIFDEFMKNNDLFKIGLSQLSDEKILKHFINAKLPNHIVENLKIIVSVIQEPIAIRSSSLLEDSHYQPFAGVYKTYMIPRIGTNPKKMVMQLENAIKSVYASVYYKESKAYMLATKNIIDEEKMAIILQEVCGKRYNNVFYPTISGVARSINFYPIELEKPEDGIASIALGLGKYIVDGGMSLRFSPKYPKKILQLSSTQNTLKETQKHFYALDLDTDSFKPSLNDGINIKKLKIKDAENDSSLKFVASTYDFQNNVIRNGVNYEGKKIITFSNILNHNIFPLSDILKELLKIGEKEMNNPVEIEFAVYLDTPKGSPAIFSFLQIRPIVELAEHLEIDIENIKQENIIISSETALGNGIIENITDIVYVNPELFNAAESKNISDEVEIINNKFIKENKNYILIGPGRWGSSDPWLGIPVNWTQISQARLIIESGLKNYRIDPSQGTHFFQNLTSFGVGYFTINPYINDGFYDLEYLSKQKAVFEGKYLRHIKFSSPVKIVIDGKRNKGIVLKPVKNHDKFN